MSRELAARIPNLVVLKGPASILPLDIFPLLDRINERHGMSLTLVSHAVADQVLAGSNPAKNPHAKAQDMLRHTVQVDFPVDMLVGFTFPNMPLGNEIVFTTTYRTRFVMPTGQYKGERGIALACMDLQTSDFHKSGGDIVIDVTGRMVPVRGFDYGAIRYASPYLMPDKATGIPSTSTHGANLLHLTLRQLYVSSVPFVGLVHRHAEMGFGDVVTLGYDMEKASSLVVEASDADMAKLKTLQRLHQLYTRSQSQ
jgi:hypothetical protein